jgi:hypothetical protein
MKNRSERMGAYGDCPPLIANETLYQLSYTPHDGLQANTVKKFRQQAIDYRRLLIHP